VCLAQRSSTRAGSSPKLKESSRGKERRFWKKTRVNGGHGIRTGGSGSRFDRHPMRPLTDRSSRPRARERTWRMASRQAGVNSLFLATTGMGVFRQGEAPTRNWLGQHADLTSSTPIHIAVRFALGSHSHVRQCDSGHLCPFISVQGLAEEAGRRALDERAHAVRCSAKSCPPILHGTVSHAMSPPSFRVYGRNTRYPY
jgi:hypothetical protein